MMTERANADFAEQMGDAHEQDSVDESRDGTRHRAMDQYNNRIGRTIGRANEGESDQEMIKDCRRREKAAAGPGDSARPKRRMARAVGLAQGTAAFVAAPFLVTGMLRVMPSVGWLPLLTPFGVLFAFAAALVAFRRRLWPLALGLALGVAIWAVALLALLASFGRGMSSM